MNPRGQLWALATACFVTLALLAAPGATDRARSKHPSLPAGAICVAPNGNDSGPGTPARPWRTIQHAADEVTPDSTVYVRAGIYDEEVTIRKSGTPQAYVSFKPFPGEQPVIDSKFKRQCGFRILSANYVRIQGFEIRNCKGNPAEHGETAGIVVAGSPSAGQAAHCILEENTIHHIIGISRQAGHGSHGKPARGILVSSADAIVVQNNTVYDIVGHTESMGIQCEDVSNMLIRRNLVYFCDKEGIRLLTQDTDTENVVEGNIAISNHMGIAINNSRTSRTTMVRSNFCAWNWGRGINPKHTKNVVLSHNTIYANQGWGIDFHGNGTPKGDNYRPVVKDNLLCLNQGAWWLYDPEVFEEQIDYNFYQNRPAGELAAWGWKEAERCHSLAEIREKTREEPSVNGPYDLHGREGDPRFVDAARGDFRLRPDSPAARAADDGQDIGALADGLVEVGARKQFSLGHIPDLGELRLSVESASSETQTGRAMNIVDGSRRTYWEIDTPADAKREIILALPHNRAVELTYLTITKFEDADSDQHFYREFEVQVDDGSGIWKPVNTPPEHPFRGYGGLPNGETWALPQGTTARRLKLHFIDSFGQAIRIPEIRLYGTNSGAN